MTNVYSFDGMIVFGLLLICTCAYLKKIPRLKQWMFSEKKGVWGIFYKATDTHWRHTWTQKYPLHCNLVGCGLWGCNTSGCHWNKIAHRSRNILCAERCVHPLAEVEILNMKLFLVVLVLIWIDAGLTSSNVEWDSSGYVMFCPCMGRLGNQLEQFLGALRFTKEMNRTLVVPPWVAYDHEAGTSFTSYDTWFDIDELGKYLRVVPMETFMNELAPVHWPDDGKSRKVYCPSGAAERSPDKKSCPAKIGNPFGPFWDHSNIEFSGGSEIFDYGKLGGFNAGRWNEIYPASEHPVIAFMGAPGSFPIKEYDRGLQKYVKFSKNMLELASKFVASNLKRPYLGIHLRNGMDWVRSCDHVEGSDVYHDFMGSPQCCGYNAWKKHTLTKEMCLPSKSSIVEKVERLAKLHNTSHLFIATDHDAMINEFKETSLTLVRYPSNYPIADWAILTMADVFIGNCVSTFTSFVIRDREVNGLPNYFWAFEKEHPKVLHEEL